jgi:hypothetical protein
MKRICCILVVGLAALSSFSPALAIGKPLVFEPFHFEGTWVVADCGTFQVLVANEAEVSLTVYLDAEGNWDRGIVDDWGTDTYTNSVTGKAVSSSFHYKAIVDFERGTQTIVGVVARLTVPGEGTVLRDAGRLVIGPEYPYVLFEAGPHQSWQGDVSSLCAAMA